MSVLSISLLGPFSALLNGEPLERFPTRSVQALLVYLICESERPHRREALMDLLWPGMPLRSAQHNLRQTIYLLRKIIPEVTGEEGFASVPFLLSNRQTVGINPTARYSADVQTFAKIVDSDPVQAIDLYHGDFLADFFLPDSETFEAWASARQTAFRRRVLIAFESLTAAYLQEANYLEADKLARRQLEVDDLH